MVPIPKAILLIAAAEVSVAGGENVPPPPAWAQAKSKGERPNSGSNREAKRPPSITPSMNSDELHSGDPQWTPASKETDTQIAMDFAASLGISSHGIRTPESSPPLDMGNAGGRKSMGSSHSLQHEQDDSSCEEEEGGGEGGEEAQERRMVRRRVIHHIQCSDSYVYTLRNEHFHLAET